MKALFTLLRFPGGIDLVGFIVVVIICSLVCPGISYGQQHIKVTSDSYTTGEINGYWEFLPQNYSNTSGSYPVLVYLHGNSGSGNGTSSALDVMLETGITRIIDQGHSMTFTVANNQQSLLVLSPQKSNNDSNWNSQDIGAFLQHAISTYRVDPSRIYLAGYSMGGRGVYEFLADEAIRDQAPSLAAAAIVGGSFKEDGACQIASADIPLLHYHSKHDNTATVTYSSAVTLIDKIRNCQTAFDPEFITLDLDSDGVPIDHDATDTISFNPQNSAQSLTNLYKWLLRYEFENGEVVVSNFPPEVNAGDDLELNLPLDPIILNGTATDPDGTVVSYLWKQVSGPAGPILENYNSPEVTVKNFRPGTYLFRLIAIDDQNDEGSDEITIKVEGVVNGLENLEETGVITYPNPFEDENILEIESSLLDGVNKPAISCTDMAGRTYAVTSSIQSVSSAQWTIRVEAHVPEGVYLLTVVSGNYSHTF
ncbi:MAG: T9SS type A sorting domain-containing protein, partial [Cyclobacteriaceae bacterium]